MLLGCVRVSNLRPSRTKTNTKHCVIGKYHTVPTSNYKIRHSKETERRWQNAQLWPMQHVNGQAHIRVVWPPNTTWRTSNPDRKRRIIARRPPSGHQIPVGFASDVDQCQTVVSESFIGVSKSTATNYNRQNMARKRGTTALSTTRRIDGGVAAGANR